MGKWIEFFTFELAVLWHLLVLGGFSCLFSISRAVFFLGFYCTVQNLVNMEIYIMNTIIYRFDKKLRLHFVLMPTLRLNYRNKKREVIPGKGVA